MNKCYICKEEVLPTDLVFKGPGDSRIHVGGECEKQFHRNKYRVNPTFHELIKASKALVSDLERCNDYQGGSYARSLKELKELLNKYAVL